MKKEWIDESTTYNLIVWLWVIQWADVLPYRRVPWTSGERLHATMWTIVSFCVGRDSSSSRFPIVFGASSWFWTQSMLSKRLVLGRCLIYERKVYPWWIGLHSCAWQGFPIQLLCWKFKITQSWCCSGWLPGCLEAFSGFPWSIPVSFVHTQWQVFPWNPQNEYRMLS